MFPRAAMTNYHKWSALRQHKDFPGGPVFKNPPANAGDMGLIPGPEILHMLWGN